MTTCPSCGHENPATNKFCGECASPLAPATSAGGSERKIVTALFCDVVGSTASADGADPEDVLARFRPYYKRMRAEVERFGGTVEKFIGDAIVGVFGAPVAHEDDPERAVRAGLRILEAIHDLNAADPSLELQVRVGVETGAAIVTLDAKSSEGEGSVIGDVMNTAARLQNVAPVNGVVVGRGTHRATMEIFNYEEMGEVAVKGKTDPLFVWRAVTARSRFGTDVVRNYACGFVGREVDLALLKGAFDKAISGPAPQLVTIVGEPGVGKTRLVAELFSQLDGRSDLITWRQGRCLPYGEAITFWALGEIVKAHAGILETDEQDAAAAKIDAVIPEDHPDAPWLRQRLRPLVGLEATPAAREENFSAWRTFLESLAETSAAVIVIEDLHWADDALLEFVEYLADYAEGVPMLLVCTARPELFEHHPGWAGGKRNALTVNLASLSGGETLHLISDLLDEDLMGEEIGPLIVERSGGNPLYAEEFVRLLKDVGTLTSSGSTWVLDPAAEIPMPSGIQGIIAARLDTLTPGRKALLQDAGVVGKVFWSGALTTMGAREPGEVTAALHELSRKEMVRPARQSSMQGEAEFGFWHGLVRDVCYGQIPRAHRAERHRRAAEWIESKARERMDDVADILAYHYSTALELSRSLGTPDDPDLIEATFRTLVRAGERAMALDVSRAASLLQRALEIAPPEHPDRLRALLRSSDAARETGRATDALRFADEAARAASTLNDVEGQGEALVLRSMVYNDLEDGEREVKALDEALALLEPAPPGRALCLAHASKADHYFRVDQPILGIEEADTAIRLARALSMKMEEISARRARGGCRAQLGDPGAIDELQEVVALSEELGGRAYGLSLNYLAGAQRDLDGPAAAAETYRRNIAFCQQRGFTFGEMVQRSGMLDVSFELGRWAEIPLEADRVIDWFAENGYVASRNEATLNFVRVLVPTGQLKQASTLVGQVLASAREEQDALQIAEAIIMSAIVALAEGNVPEAAELIAEYRGARRLFPRIETPHLPDLVRMCCVVGERTLAARAVEEAAPAVPRHRCAKASAAALFSEIDGDFSRAAGLHGEAADGWAAFGSIYEEGHSWLGQGRCLMALDRHREALEPITRAREIFASMGATSLVGEADAFLGP
jgi:class 3 adenylate cyclase/tetratricopeptide (TPR) repeat protein